MPTQSWASALLIICLALPGCGRASDLPGGPPLAAPQAEVAKPETPSPEASTSVLRVDSVDVPVSLDRASIDVKQGSTVSVVKKADGKVLLIESWASLPQSMSRCQAGQERWLRLIDIAAREELFAKQIESCLNDILPGDPVAEWPDGASQIKVSMLSEPSFTITTEGKVVAK